MFTGVCACKPAITVQVFDTLRANYYVKRGDSGVARSGVPGKQRPVTRTIAFRVDDKTHDNFGSICRSAGLSPSEVLRSFVIQITENSATAADALALGAPFGRRRIDVFLERILQSAIVSAVVSAEILRNGGGREMETHALKQANDLLGKTLKEIEEASSSEHDAPNLRAIEGGR